MSDDDRRPARTGRRRWWPWIAGAVAGLWLLAAAVLLLGAKADAEAGRDRLKALREAEDPADALLDGGAGELRLAGADFRSARRAVRSPIVSPLRALPVIGRQLRVFDALAASAGRVAETGGEALDRIDDRIASGTAAGGERVALVDEIAAATAEVEEVLATVDLGPDDALIGPVASARREFAQELEDVRALVADARAVAEGLRPMLAGPSRYLVLGANNAEMQVSSGMPLSVGVLDIADGRLDLPGMRPSFDIAVPPGAVPLDPDVEARWGFLSPGGDFRLLGLTPRFEVTGEQAARMWEASGGGPVDGVLLVDPVVLAALLRASGPVEVDGTTFDAGNAVDQLLYQQYVDFGLDQDARRDRLGRVAGAAVDALDQGGWDVAALASDLADAAAERHVLAWSRYPDQQAAWEAAGVAGDLEDDGLFLGMYNVSGTKSDPFIDVAADIVVEGEDVTATVTVTNGIPDGEPQYVAGPASPDRVYGQYDALLSVTVPGYVEGAELDQQVAPPTGKDGDDIVLTTRVNVLQGAREVRVLRFRVPPEARRLTLEGTGRLPGVRWSLDGEPAPGDRIAW